MGSRRPPSATVFLMLTLGPITAYQPIAALAPVETVLEGRDELIGVAVTAEGTRYVSDRGAGIVYRLSSSGALSRAAAGLDRPAGLALDSGGRFLIAEEHAGRILRLEDAGALTVLATGIKSPRWLAVASDGSLYIGAHRLVAPDGLDADEGCVILRLAPDGSLTTVAAGIRRLEGLLRVNDALVAATTGLEGGPDSQGTILRYSILHDGTLGAPATLVDAGLKRPIGLALDALAAIYVSTRRLTVETEIARRAIGKIHTDGHLTDFAGHLIDPQGLAFDAGGALYLADGKAGRLLKFRAPPAPTLTAPAFADRSPLTITGAANPGARVDLCVDPRRRRPHVGGCRGDDRARQRRPHARFPGAAAWEPRAAQREPPGPGAGQRELGRRARAQRRRPVAQQHGRPIPAGARRDGHGHVAHVRDARRLAHARRDRNRPSGKLRDDHADRDRGQFPARHRDHRRTRWRGAGHAGDLHVHGHGQSHTGLGAPVRVATRRRHVVRVDHGAQRHPEGARAGRPPLRGQGARSRGERGPDARPALVHRGAWRRGDDH